MRTDPLVLALHPEVLKLELFDVLSADDDACSFFHSDKWFFGCFSCSLVCQDGAICCPILTRMCSSAPALVNCEGTVLQWSTGLNTRQQHGLVQHDPIGDSHIHRRSTTLNSRT